MKTPTQKPQYDPDRQEFVARQGLSDISVLASRVHELALQRWFYKQFMVIDGYPTPVVFATPMDAFSEFDRLFKDKNSPFNYLKSLKDANGQPIYEPYPSNARYPLISVKRTSWSYRPSMSFGIHKWRNLGWPAVARVDEGLEKKDLAWTTQSQMPTAWNYKFQCEHYSMRPDTQARFVHQLMRSWSYSGSSGGQPQTWIPVAYPGFQGLQMVRMYMDSDATDATEDPNPEMPIVYRTSFSVVIEGYFADLDIAYIPALWSLVFQDVTSLPMNQDYLEAFYEIATTGTIAYDLRVNGTNPLLDSRADVPPWGPVPTVLTAFGTSPTPSGRILNGILP